MYHEIALRNQLSDTAFLILYDLSEFGDGYLQRDIADKNCVSKQTINSATKKLEREGYLILKEGKGRDKHIYLTDAGRQLIQEKIEPVIHMENSIFEELSEKESRELLRLTKKYVAIYRKKVKETKK